MDPLSTVKSAISVVQGIAATKRLVDLIKEIPEAQNQYEEFANELVVLEYMVENAPPNLANHPVISIVESQLKQLLNELRDVEKKCAHESTLGKMPKAKKYRWLLEGNQIQRLRDRAFRVKQDLSVVLGLEQQNALCSDREEKVLFQKRLDEFMTQQENMIQILVKDRVQCMTTGRVEELPDNGEAHDPQFPSSNSTTPQESPIPTIYPPEKSHKYPNIGSSDLNFWTSVAPMTLSGCLQTCQCHCHFNQSRKRNLGWMESLFGISNGNGKRNPRHKKPKTCILGCKGNIRAPFQFEARPFGWLGREWPDIRLSLSIRPRKLIPTGAEVLRFASKPAEVILEFMKSGFDVFPDEETVIGKGLAEVALDFAYYDLLEVLLKVVWKNLLPRQRLPRRIFYAASHYLRVRKLNDRETNLLLLAKSWADHDGIEERQTSLFMALSRGQSIEEELKNQPWAIDELDHLGFAPIHLAAQQSNTIALDALIKAGADVDLEDYEGSTALMHASYHGHLEVIKRLILAKCQVNLRNHNGQTALHGAMACDPDVCFELLKAGASSALADHFGQTPLHILGSLMGNEVVNREKIRLLVAGGANLEARNENGHTPAFFALVGGNFEAFSWFVQAGASLLPVDNRGLGLLHLAASGPALPLLEYLISLNISGMNTQQEDSDDDTAWDMFVLTITTPHWQNTFGRPIDPREKETFVQLYQGIRDRNMQDSIGTLKRVHEYIIKMDKEEAVEVLEPLIKRMDDWNQDDLLFNCHDIKTAILEGKWEEGMKVVNHSIADLEIQMQASPWAQKSWYDERLEGGDKKEELEAEDYANAVSEDVDN